MKTLKDFKARFVVGAKLDVTNHRIACATGLRTVTKVQTNGYWFTQDTAPTPTTPDGRTQDRVGQRCWGVFPKAKDLEIEGADTAVIFDDGKPFIQIRFVKEAPMTTGKTDTITTPEGD